MAGIASERVEVVGVREGSEGRGRERGERKGDHK